MPSLTSIVLSAMHVCKHQPPVNLNQDKTTHVHSPLNFLVAINTAVTKVAYRASVHTAFFLLKLGNEFHGANLGCSAHRPLHMLSGKFQVFWPTNSPAGKIERNASNRVLPGRNTPETSETRCCTCENWFRRQQLA